MMKYPGMHSPRGAQGARRHAGLGYDCTPYPIRLMQWVQRCQRASHHVVDKRAFCTPPTTYPAIHSGQHPE